MGNPTGEFAAAIEDARRKPGRPPGPSKVTRRNVLNAQRMFQEYAEEAMLTMVEIMRDPDADHAVRLKAANDIQNRAYGTPVTTQVQHKIISDETGSPISTAAISAAGSRELEMLALTLARFVESEKNTLDITPDMPPEYPD